MKLCWGRVALYLFCLLMAAQTWAAEPLGHKGRYDISLKSPQNKAGLVAVRGTTDYHFNDVCNGWVIENFSEIQFQYGDGRILNTTWNYSAWESKDGTKFRFNVRQSQNGRETKDIVGSIDRESASSNGFALIERPEEQELEFPPGTLFPTRHTLAILAAAEDGKGFVSKHIFDGGGLDNPFEVNAMIGKEQVSGKISVKGGDAFDAQPSWKVHMAYFKPNDSAAMPHYEMGLNYRQDGIATQIDQNFLDFELRATLKEIERLPKPDC